MNLPAQSHLDTRSHQTKPKWLELMFKIWMAQKNQAIDCYCCQPGFNSQESHEKCSERCSKDEECETISEERSDSSRRWSRRKQRFVIEFCFGMTTICHEFVISSDHFDVLFNTTPVLKTESKIICVIWMTLICCSQIILGWKIQIFMNINPSFQANAKTVFCSNIFQFSRQNDRIWLLEANLCQYFSNIPDNVQNCTLRLEVKVMRLFDSTELPSQYPDRRLGHIQDNNQS